MATLTATVTDAVGNPASQPVEITVGGGPDIYAHGFEDGTVGDIVNNVLQPASGTIITTDGARGTRSLEMSYGTTPSGDGSAGAYNYFLPSQRTDVWARFALKYDAFPDSIQKVFRFRGSDGSGQAMGTMVYQGDRFKWLWDDYDTTGFRTLATGPLAADAWHWIEIHLTANPGQLLTVEIFHNDVSVFTRSSGGANTGDKKVMFFILDGTLNQGNTIPFTMLFDELGVSSQQMGIPQ